MTTLHHPSDPRIGMIIRGGAPIFYAYHQGYTADPIEGTLDAVEAALGISYGHRAESPAAPRAVSQSRTSIASARLRRYAVAVSPLITVYSGNQTLGESVEYVFALNRRDAEKQVRQMLRETNGRHAPRCKVSARLTDESY